MHNGDVSKGHMDAPEGPHGESEIVIMLVDYDDGMK